MHYARNKQTEIILSEVQQPKTDTFEKVTNKMIKQVTLAWSRTKTSSNQGSLVKFSPLPH